jgi:outer membrane phospholipase A
VAFYAWRIPAQEATSMVIPSTRGYTAGTNGTVFLYHLNELTQDQMWLFPPSMPGTLSAGSTNFPISLVITNGTSIPTPVRPGGFLKQEYSFDIPRNISGEVRLSVSNYSAVLVQVDNAKTQTNSSESMARKQSKEGKPTTGSAILGFLDRRLSVYEPIFFLLGTYPAAEFQFSMKFKVFGTEGEVNPLAHFYFAYTQTSFWDLLTRDPSFFDTSYKPSMFLLYSNVLNRGAFQLDLQGGAEHESNGRGGTGERSLYTLYAQPTARVDLSHRLEFAVQPRVWEYLSVGANNDDLPAYRGYADLRTSLTWYYDDARRIQLADQFRIGTSGHPGLLIDLRIDLPAWAKFNPTLQLQYFTGYGQTLRQYNEYSHGFRAGLCLHY